VISHVTIVSNNSIVVKGLAIYLTINAECIYLTEGLVTQYWPARKHCHGIRTKGKTGQNNKAPYTYYTDSAYVKYKQKWPTVFSVLAPSPDAPALAYAGHSSSPPTLSELNIRGKVRIKQHSIMMLILC